jgi:hypothetical protein
LNEGYAHWKYFVGDKEYMVGDTITFEIDLYHEANVRSVTAVFVHESDEEVAIYLEGTPYEDSEWQEGGKKSMADLTAEVTSQHRPGEYSLDRLVTETAGGRVTQIPAEEVEVEEAEVEAVGVEEAEMMKDYMPIYIQIVEEPSGVRITRRRY